VKVWNILCGYIMWLFFLFIPYTLSWTWNSIMWLSTSFWLSGNCDLLLPYCFIFYVLNDTFKFVITMPCLSDLETRYRVFCWLQQNMSFVAFCRQMIIIIKELIGQLCHLLITYFSTSSHDWTHTVKVKNNSFVQLLSRLSLVGRGQGIVLMRWCLLAAPC